MPKLIVTDHDQNEHVIDAPSGTAMMEPLRDADLIDATCGGAASCGTCHIYLTNGWREKSGDRTEDEGYMLEALEELVEIKEESRLACQIKLTDDLDGISMDIAPQI